MSSRRLFAFIILFVIFLAENTLNFFLREATPSLLLVTVLFFSFAEGAAFGAFAGLWAGFLLDLLGLGKPGLFMSAFACVGLASGTVSSKVFQDSLFAEILLPVVCLYGVMLAEAWAIAHASGEAAGPYLVAEAFRPWKLLSTVLISPWLFARLRRMRSGPERRVRARY